MIDIPPSIITSAFTDIITDAFINITVDIIPDLLEGIINNIFHAILYQSSLSAKRKTLRLIVSQATSLTLLYVLLSTLFQRLYSTLS